MQEYRFADLPPDSPAQVFLLVAGHWWRFFSDGPQMYCRAWNGEPSAWAIPEERMAAPLRDLGHELDLRDQIIEAWAHGIRNDAPAMSISFADGRQLSFFGTGNGWSDFELVRWFMD